MKTGKYQMINQLSKDLLADVKAIMEKKLDPVNDKENDKKFKDRKDKDIDNDGDVDNSDEYLHKKRAATDDAIDGGKKPAKTEDKGQFIYAAKQAKKKGEKEFMFAGKKYTVDTDLDDKE